MNVDHDNIQIMLSMLQQLPEALLQLAQLTENFLTNILSLVRSVHSYI